MSLSLICLKCCCLAPSYFSPSSVVYLCPAKWKNSWKAGAGNCLQGQTSETLPQPLRGRRHVLTNMRGVGAWTGRGQGAGGKRHPSRGWRRQAGGSRGKPAPSSFCPSLPISNVSIMVNASLEKYNLSHSPSPHPRNRKQEA